MTTPSAPAHQHGVASLETVVTDGFAQALQTGLNRSRYARSRRSADAAAPAAPQVRPATVRDRDGSHDHDDCVWYERRRLAREVHDELGAALATAAHRIELHAVEATPDTAEGTHLDAARRAIREAIELTRRMAGGLHDQTVLPPLPRVLREFATTASEAVDVRFRTTGNERLLSDACRRELFLTVKEAMSNAFRHSGARQVTVTMRFTPRWAHARIADTGVGFDTDDVLAPGFRAPGLRSMTDRIEDLGGRLTIASDPGSGTRVDVHLPLRPRT
ncbi:ATP-binding protein [Streptomyces sp. NPDC050619]|uniref:sensor histidine kinase n=1 Tax=Streptomyces sp. NPDC050619 TaxID=3157214 RepID=UPI00341EB859